jgi:hypothetical protein
MDLLPLFQWFEATFIGTKVRESLWMFPVIECFHLLALAMLGGAVIALDLRMLGFSLREQPVPELEQKLRPWLNLGVIGLIATGVPMFLSEAIKCYYSPPFWYKIGILVIAVIFTYTVRRRVAAKSAGTVLGGATRLTALASLAMWFGVAFSGRWIAFY